MSERWYILRDREAVPASMMEWAHWCQANDRHVARTQVRPGVAVSTVFLGLDHNFMPDGPPLIFETMIFGGAHSDDQWRYSTLDEAEAGHRRAMSLAAREGSDK